MSEHPFHRRTRHSTRVRAGRSLPLLFLTLLILLLTGCDTAQAPPASDPDETPNETPSETPRDEPAPEVPNPDPAEVSIALEPISAADGAGNDVIFERPLGVVTAGDGDALYVMQQGGVVDVLEDGVVRDPPFLDLSDRVEVDGEAGLLGLVFHPNYPDVPDVFVHYTWLRTEGLMTTVSRMPVRDGVAVRDEEEILFEVEQPSSMHNGGQLAFGPDGMLYVAVGEGATTPDADGDMDSYTPLPPGNPGARGPENPLGTILRLDPAAPENDYVPTDNPYADGTEGDPHVWLYGLRNPWRFSFDAVTDDLWLADVGEGRVEEINVVPDAEPTLRDFGWNRREGDECVDPDGCADLESVEPVITYRTDGDESRGSVTGGYVYYGEALEDLRGAYVFGDYVRGTISAAAPGEGGYEVESLLDTELSIASFGVGTDGELLVVDYGDYSWPEGVLERDGGLYRIVPAPAAAAGA